MKPITIVGGGLAGLTLGIALRQRDVPVVIVEAGRYPRHRVCGEFINGQGLPVLAGLGLMERLRTAGGRDATTVAFFSARGASPVRRLPQAGFCLSRFVLDAELARCFTGLGGQLSEGSRWSDAFNQPGVVRATGRVTRLTETGSRWFGLKAHARRLDLSADLEMHLGPRGYVGICRVEGDRANVCGLFRRPPAAPTPPRDLVNQFCDGIAPELRRRLERAAWDEASICTVGGLPLHVGLPGRSDQCVIGDAAAMIPPVTGNGMSMAFESAELAAVVLADHAAERLSWEETCRRMADAQRKRFRRRLGRANLLHRGLFSERWSPLLIASATASPWLWRRLVAGTR